MCFSHTADSPVKRQIAAIKELKMAERSGGGRSRSPLTDDTIRSIWNRLRKGEFQHDIAADLGLNQGRVSEVNTGKRGRHITGLTA